MIEIVFNESAGGSLKMAQRYGEGEYQGGCISIVLSHSDGSEPTEEEIRKAQLEIQEKERLAYEKAVPMGGDPADVYSFSLAMDIGDISEAELGPKREQVLEKLYSIYPESDEGERLAQIWIKQAKENLKIICSRAAAGEPMRIWYSNLSDEVCGFYWFMYQLNQLNALNKEYGPVYMISLPLWEYDEQNNVIIKRKGWGEVAPGEWSGYLSRQELLPPSFCRSCASDWQSLQEENAPLRAILNGQLVSMPEPLYDDFIRREIAAMNDEFILGMIVGRVIGKYQISSDALIALRIKEMINAGELEIVSEAPEGSLIYRQMLRKRQK